MRDAVESGTYHVSEKSMSTVTSEEATNTPPSGPEKRSVCIVLENWPEELARSVERVIDALTDTARAGGTIIQTPDEVDLRYLLGMWHRGLDNAHADPFVVRQYQLARSAITEDAIGELAADSKPDDGFPQATLIVTGNAWWVASLQLIAEGRGMVARRYTRWANGEMPR